jgi:predicted dehydrogenase
VADRNYLFVALTRHFLEVVARTAAPICTLADGVAAVRVAAAIERSSAESGKDVTP